MAIYGYTKNYKLIKPKYDTDTWHDYEYDNLDTIDAVLSAIYASGNWKGFWATNTDYVVGDVVIDRDTDTMYKVMVEHTTSAGSFAAEWTAHHNYYELWSPNNLAESWATKTDDKVSNTDYSAKAYAISSGLINDGSAKEWAIGSGAIGTTNEYSAKKYATDAHNDYISMTSDANVVAVGSNITNVNAVGQSISSVNTVANNVSSVNTVAGSISDVNTVASIASSVTTVADNNANITTVATNISDVNTAATNIAAIQDASNQAASANNSKIEAQNSASQASQSATSAAQSAQTATDKADEASESARLAVSALSLQIGDVCFVPLGIDESLNLRRYLNGQVLIQSQFVSFTSKVKSAIALYPNLATTEENWQAEKTNSKLGQCGKFVVDDTAGTIRLPCVVNAQGLVDLAMIGGIKNESLPNFQANMGDVFPYTETSGAVTSTKKTVGWTIVGGSNLVNGDTTVNPSVTSSTYQDNAPVQQEAVQYPYCIVVNTGVEESDRPINNYQVNNVYSYGMSQYYKGTMNNNSWLKSAGQWNDGTVYTGMYNWLLEQMNAGVSGFVASTATYTDYDFVINTTDQTFRLPLLNGEEDLPGDTFEAVTYNGHDSAYTAKKNGHFSLYGYGSSAYIFLHNKTSSDYSDCAGSIDSVSPCGVSVKCKKGDIVQAGYYGGTITSFGFTPAVGNGSLYYYIGDTLQNAQLINVARIEEKLVDKAKTDASNFTAAGKQNVVGWGMPNYNAPVNITAAVAAGYTATYKQCVAVQCKKNAVETSTSTLKLNNIVYDIAWTSSNNQWHESNTLFLMLDVGDTIMTNRTNAVWYIVAYPLKGV